MSSGGLALAVVLAALWLSELPKWQLPDGLHTKDQAIIENEYRKTAAQILIGLGGICLIYFTWMRSSAADKAQEQQITERFTRAIVQLGDERMAVRLGGIYARLLNDFLPYRVIFSLFS